MNKRKDRILTAKLCLLLGLIALSCCSSLQQDSVVNQLDKKVKAIFKDRSSLTNYRKSDQGKSILYYLEYGSGLKVTVSVQNQSISIVEYELSSQQKSQTNEKSSKNCTHDKKKILTQVQLDAVFRKNNQIDNSYVLISYRVINDGYVLQYQSFDTTYIFELDWDLRIRRRQTTKKVVKVVQKQVTTQIDQKTTQQITQFIQSILKFKGYTNPNIERIARTGPTNYRLLLIITWRGNPLKYQLTLTQTSPTEFTVDDAYQLESQVTLVPQYTEQMTYDQEEIGLIEGILRASMTQPVPVEFRLARVWRDRNYFKFYYVLGDSYYEVEFRFNPIKRSVQVTKLNSLIKQRQVVKTTTPQIPTPQPIPQTVPQTSPSTPSSTVTEAKTAELTNFLTRQIKTLPKSARFDRITVLNERTYIISYIITIRKRDIRYLFTVRQDANGGLSVDGSQFNVDYTPEYQEYSNLEDSPILALDSILRENVGDKLPRGVKMVRVDRDEPYFRFYYVLGSTAWQIQFTFDPINRKMKILKINTENIPQPKKQQPNTQTNPTSYQITTTTASTPATAPAPAPAPAPTTTTEPDTNTKQKISNYLRTTFTTLPKSAKIDKITRLPNNRFLIIVIVTIRRRDIRYQFTVSQSTTGEYAVEDSQFNVDFVPSFQDFGNIEDNAIVGLDLILKQSLRNKLPTEAKVVRVERDQPFFRFYYALGGNRWQVEFTFDPINRRINTRTFNYQQVTQTKQTDSTLKTNSVQGSQSSSVTIQNNVNTVRSENLHQVSTLKPSQVWQTPQVNQGSQRIQTTQNVPVTVSTRETINRNTVQTTPNPTVSTTINTISNPPLTNVNTNQASSTVLSNVQPIPIRSTVIETQSGTIQQSSPSYVLPTSTTRPSFVNVPTTTTSTSTTSTSSTSTSTSGTFDNSQSSQPTINTNANTVQPSQTQTVNTVVNSKITLNEPIRPEVKSQQQAVSFIRRTFTTLPKSAKIDKVTRLSDRRFLIVVIVTIRRRDVRYLFTVNQSSTGEYTVEDSQFNVDFAPSFQDFPNIKDDAIVVLDSLVRENLGKKVPVQAQLTRVQRDEPFFRFYYSMGGNRWQIEFTFDPINKKTIITNQNFSTLLQPAPQQKPLNTDILNSQPSKVVTSTITSISPSTYIPSPLTNNLSPSSSSSSSSSSTSSSSSSSSSSFSSNSNSYTTSSVTKTAILDSSAPVQISRTGDNRQTVANSIERQEIPIANRNQEINTIHLMKNTQPTFIYPAATVSDTQVSKSSSNTVNFPKPLQTKELPVIPLTAAPTVTSTIIPMGPTRVTTTSTVTQPLTTTTGSSGSRLETTKNQYIVNIPTPLPSPSSLPTSTSTTRFPSTHTQTPKRNPATITLQPKSPPKTTSKLDREQYSLIPPQKFTRISNDDDPVIMQLVNFALSNLLPEIERIDPKFKIENIYYFIRNVNSIVFRFQIRAVTGMIVYFFEVIPEIEDVGRTVSLSQVIQDRVPIVQAGNTVTSQIIQIKGSNNLPIGSSTSKKQQPQSTSILNSNQQTISQEEATVSFIRRTFTTLPKSAKIDKVTRLSDRRFLIVVIVTIRRRDLRYQFTISQSSTGEYTVEDSQFNIDFTPSFQDFPSIQDNAIVTLDSLVRENLKDKLPVGAKVIKVERDEPFFKFFYSFSSGKYQIEFLFDPIVKKIKIINFQFNKFPQPASTPKIVTTSTTISQFNQNPSISTSTSTIKVDPVSSDRRQDSFTTTKIITSGTSQSYDIQPGYQSVPVGNSRGQVSSTLIQANTESRPVISQAEKQIKTIEQVSSYIRNTFTALPKSAKIDKVTRLSDHRFLVIVIVTIRKRDIRYQFTVSQTPTGEYTVQDSQFNIDFVPSFQDFPNVEDKAIVVLDSMLRDSLAGKLPANAKVVRVERDEPFFRFYYVLGGDRWQIEFSFDPIRNRILVGNIKQQKQVQRQTITIPQQTIVDSKISSQPASVSQKTITITQQSVPSQPQIPTTTTTTTTSTFNSYQLTQPQHTTLLNTLQTELKDPSIRNYQIYRVQKTQFGYRVVLFYGGVYYQAVFSYNGSGGGSGNGVRFVSWGQVSKQDVQGNLYDSDVFYPVSLDGELQGVLLKTFPREKLGNIKRITQAKVRISADGYVYLLTLQTITLNKYSVTIHHNPILQSTQILTYQHLNLDPQSSSTVQQEVLISDIPNYETDGQLYSVLAFIEDRFEALGGSYVVYVYRGAVGAGVLYRVGLRDGAGVGFEVLVLWGQGGNMALVGYKKLYDGYAKIDMTSTALQKVIQFTKSSIQNEYPSQTPQFEGALVRQIPQLGRLYRIVVSISGVRYCFVVYVSQSGVMKINGIEGVPAYYSLLSESRFKVYGELRSLVGMYRKWVNGQGTGSVTLKPQSVVKMASSQPQQYVTTKTSYRYEYDPTSDFNCLSYKDGICLRCAYRFYIKNGQCVKISDQCKQYNKQTGECLACYTGYTLRAGTCSTMNQLCQSTNSQGQCTKCYKGYQLITGSCYRTLSGPNTSNLQRQYIDELCEQQVNGVCTKCTGGTYMSRKSGSCKVKDPYCEDFDEVNEVVLKCMRGYELQGGKCVRAL